MSLIVYPVASQPRVFTPRNFSLRLATVQRVHSSPLGGSEQAVDLLNDRWIASLELSPRTQDEAASLEAWIASMRGLTNTTSLYHFARPVPRGTLSGAPTAQVAVQGAASIVLDATTGQTLKAGDLIGVSGLLLQASADCVAVAGAITVPLVNRLRKAITAGSVVTWSAPTAEFRLVSQPAVQYVPGYAEGVSLDFVEAI